MKINHKTMEANETFFKDHELNEENFNTIANNGYKYILKNYDEAINSKTNKKIKLNALQFFLFYFEKTDQFERCIVIKQLMDTIDDKD